MTLFNKGHMIEDLNLSEFEDVTGDHSIPSTERRTPPNTIPGYMHDVYEWAYINPFNVNLLDHEWVVAAILLGNSQKLQHALMAEISPGQRVLQAAHVYGGLIADMAKKIGPEGFLDVIDVVPLQAGICQKKLEGFPQTRVQIADARDFKGGVYDLVSCFFLLHELPDSWKRAVVDNLLASVGPGGRAIFVDYHGPARWHPAGFILRPLLARLEPFAESLWDSEIREFCSTPDDFEWRTETFFGGLYQKTVVTRIS